VDQENFGAKFTNDLSIFQPNIPQMKRNSAETGAPS